MHKNNRGLINSAGLLCGLLLLCLGCSHQKGEPGTQQPVANGTVYYLQDGVFIQEHLQGTNYYYLMDESVIDFSLIPVGLEVVLEKNEDSSILSRRGARCEVARPPTNFVTTIIKEPEVNFSRFNITPEGINNILNSLGPVTTVRDIKAQRQP